MGMEIEGWIGIGRPPFASIRWLMDVFVESGIAEEEDLPHLEQVFGWLAWEGEERD